MPATREHMEQQRDVWRPLLNARGDSDASWPWLEELIEAEAHELEWEAYALVESPGVLHGLMSIRLMAETVYVERIAVAPWNRVGSVPRQRLACGSRLLVHAMRKSVAKGYGGRISLHALEEPNAPKFYREQIKMTEVRIDFIDEMYLRYFELSDAQALEWIEVEVK
ncbi:MAG: hypothetical protein JNK82_33350 [Myxococcaceae bacterium]|nr:hypothetical protein [Myxococcaceae bacterium]